MQECGQNAFFVVGGGRKRERKEESQAAMLQPAQESKLSTPHTYETRNSGLIASVREWKERFLGAGETDVVHLEALCNSFVEHERLAESHDLSLLFELRLFPYIHE